MKVIIISPNKQSFNGKSYWCSGRRYFFRHTAHHSYSLHRDVWEYHNGKIPRGFHIHHKDHDGYNNQLSNLELKRAGQHLSDHMTPEKRERMKLWIEEIRPLANKWHGSKEGLEFHKRLGKLSWENKRYTIQKCMECGKDYSTPFPMRSKYCHPNCKQRALRRRYKEQDWTLSG